MKKLPSVFISYNSNSETEETLALRLHTIGAVHGFNMLLPDRYYDANTISIETKNRINTSNYYILFSTTNKLSKVALEEIQFAFNKLKDKSRIIIIYDVAKGKNMTGTDLCTEIFLEKNESPEQFSGKVLHRISEHQNAQNKKEREAMGGLVLAGLGLLLLGSLVSDK